MASGQKEFFPQMETLGPYVPGTVGDYFRNVKAWKEVGNTLDDCFMMFDVLN